LPICPQCGSYFVRKPCPSCSDKTYDDPYKNSGTTTSFSTNVFEKKPIEPIEKILTPTNALTSEKKTKETEMVNEIKKLKNEINEKEIEIQRLKNIIKSINREVSKL